MKYEDKVKETFSDSVAENWGNKSKYISKIIGTNYKFTSFIDLYCCDNISILEVGCGNGKNLIYIDKNYKNCNIVGLDLSHDMINQINYNFINSKIKLYYKDIFELSEKNKYDLIIVKQVLHHIKDKQKFIKKLDELLKTKGRILLMFPNEKFFNNIYKFNKNTIDVFGRISEDIFRDKLNNSNLKIIKIFNKEFIYEFENLKKVIKYLYSIGTLQKISEYKFNKKIYDLYITVFNNFLENKLTINIEISYTYVVLEKS